MLTLKNYLLIIDTQCAYIGAIHVIPECEAHPLMILGFQHMTGKYSVVASSPGC